MPIARIQLPDGRIGRFEVPDGTTPEQAQALAEQTIADAPERSVLGEIGRQIGLTARAGISGITGLAGAVADVPFRLARAAGIEAPLPSEQQQRLMTKAGLPEPETGTERFAQAAASGMAGAATGMGIGSAMAGGASPVTQGVGLALQQAPAAQVVGGATGAAGAHAAAESGVGPLGQMAAGMAAGAAPSLVRPAFDAAVRGAVRGGESGRAKMDQRIKNFEEVGVDPSVSQATGNDRTRLVESAASLYPGGQGVMTRAAQHEAAQMGAKVDELATALLPKTTQTTAGLAIEKGIKAFGDRFKAVRSGLYDALDSKIPKDTTVDVSNTKNALEALNAEIPGAPNLSKFFENKTIKSIQEAFKKDTQDTGVNPASPENRLRLPEEMTGAATGKLPYEALRKLRTLVGEEMDNNSLVSNVPRSKWNALYASISKDMEAAAVAQGPEATKAFVRANSYYKAGRARLDDFLERVGGQKTAEDIYRAATGEVQQGASTINAIMRSVGPEERRAVTAQFVRRMGLATPGKQGAEGDTFSPQTFLTNWNKVTPEAKNILFGRHAPGMKQDLNHLAQVADNMITSSRAFANPSGTTQAYFTTGNVAGVASAIVTGNIPVAAGLMGGMAGANMTARMMTSPAFVRWLSRTTKVSPATVPTQIENLTWIAANQKDPELKADIQKYQGALQ